MLSYEDGAAAIDWLCRAFGFREREGSRRVDEGRVTHAELDVGDGTVVFLASPTPDYESPRRHREGCEAARRWSQSPWVIDGVLVRVLDVDRHRRRSQDEGAEMLSEIEETPFGRLYRAEDVEGHRWMFLEPT
jgi:PhnB protein